MHKKVHDRPFGPVVLVTGDPATASGGDTFFAMKRVVSPESLHWRTFSLLYELTESRIVDVEVDREVAFGNGRTDESMVSPVTFAHPASTNLDDGVATWAPGKQVIHAVFTRVLGFLGFPQVIEPIAHVSISVGPTTFTDRVTDDHVHVPLGRELETEDTSQNDRIDDRDVTDEFEPDAGHIRQGAVHADDDVGRIRWTGDVTKLDVSDHALLRGESVFNKGPLAD